MKKKKTALVVALVLMGVAVLGLGAAVYAKYIASITGNGTATVAKWAFEEDNQSDVVTCPTTSYNTNTLVNGKIAPGTTGTCVIELKNTNSEVGIDYKIKLSSIANKPKNLKFYSDSGYQTELATDGTGSITGHLDAKGGTKVTSTETIYWKWEYETETGAAVATDAVVDNQKAGDLDDDTAAGEAANTLTFAFDIQGWQAQPQ